MSDPCEPRPCALHVLVPGGEVGPLDASGLLTALGARVGEVIVRTVPDADGDVPLDALRLAAAVIDDLAVRTDRAVAYEEAHDLLPALRRDAERGVRSVVVLPATCSRRTVRRIRRAIAGAGAHLAVVPTGTRGAMAEGRS